MAQHNHASQVRQLSEAAGITMNEAAQNINAAGGKLDLRYGEYITWNRREEAATDQAYELLMSSTAKKTQTPDSPASKDFEPATDKQVAFIIKLIAQDRHEGCWASVPTDIVKIKAMSKQAASTAITAMLEN